MKTVKVSIEETLKYRREMVISVPDTMTDKELNKLLGGVERGSEQASDMPFEIQKLNPEIKVIESPDEDLDNPDDMSVEINDFNEVK